MFGDLPGCPFFDDGQKGIRNFELALRGRVIPVLMLSVIERDDSALTVSRHIKSRRASDVFSDQNKGNSHFIITKRDFTAWDYVGGNPPPVGQLELPGCYSSGRFCRLGSFLAVNHSATCCTPKQSGGYPETGGSQN
ncbi:MAG TPA: hypothetical protein VFE41_11875 [Acetobacteraceae bacterium]|nr:hypothetical protein [Acetobacteraceae bacterium]